jgi:hypothetical protein
MQCEGIVESKVEDIVQINHRAIDPEGVKTHPPLLTLPACLHKPHLELLLLLRRLWKFFAPLQLITLSADCTTSI